jgi:hypothetical protein
MRRGWQMAWRGDQAAAFSCDTAEEAEACESFVKLA